VFLRDDEVSLMAHPLRRCFTRRIGARTPWLFARSGAGMRR
jgi:hypothetical protein